jgi:DNA-binding transcriptional regulator YdaS (Cro superfamily)
MSTNVDLLSLLAERDLKVEDFADRMGVHKTQVYRWHNLGVPNGERAVEIERVIGIPRQLVRPDLYSGMIFTTSQEGMENAG